MSKAENLKEIVNARIDSNKFQIIKSIDCDRKGLPILAEGESDRRRAAIQRKYQIPSEMVDLIQQILVKEEAIGDGREAIQGPTADFVPIGYLERGLLVAKAVARITSLQNQPIGTGFLASSNLLVTNNHVISTPLQATGFLAQFNYERDLSGIERPPTAFRLDPNRFFFTDGIEGLDVTIVAIGERVSGDRPVTSFGWCGLSDSGTKHALGDYVTIIQHPSGRHKEVVLRENMIAGRDDVALHYVADTEPGSSGSPVFNANWQPVALHHWGGTHAWGGDGTYLPNTINEGIRISRIVRKIREVSAGFNAEKTQLVAELLQNGAEGFPESSASVPGAPNTAPNTPAGNTARINPDGSVTWTLPLEVSVNLPGAMGNSQPSVTNQQTTTTPDISPPGTEATAPKPGYRPDFIDGHIVPLPEMTATRKKKIARIKPDKLQPGANDKELRYQHFTVVMNAERRMAYFTAVNIHGESLLGYSRKTKNFYDYTKASRAFAESLGGAEGGDSWAFDDRIDAAQQTAQSFYLGINPLIKANGHKNLAPTADFDRGHLVKRLDPVWGQKSDALIAERDTFHWTNAAPQTPSFNRGNATKDLGKQKGRLWQGIENYILRSAWAADTKVCVFTGPVFDAKDPVYSNKDKSLQLQIPLKFWKVVVWSDKGKLQSLALVADQLQTMVKKPEAEDLLDADQLELMKSFLTTVAKVEKLTGFEFGQAVSKADVRFGKKDIPDDDDTEFN